MASVSVPKIFQLERVRLNVCNFAALPDVNPSNKRRRAEAEEEAYTGHTSFRPASKTCRLMDESAELVQCK